MNAGTPATSCAFGSGDVLATSCTGCTISFSSSFFESLAGVSGVRPIPGAGTRDFVRRVCVPDATSDSGALRVPAFGIETVRRDCVWGVAGPATLAAVPCSEVFSCSNCRYSACSLSMEASLRTEELEDICARNSISKPQAKDKGSEAID